MRGLVYKLIQFEKRFEYWFSENGIWLVMWFVIGFYVGYVVGNLPK